MDYLVRCTTFRSRDSPATVQHDHMVELQSFGAMGGEQQQSSLATTYIPAPFGQPLDEVIYRSFPATSLQLMLFDSLPQQVVPRIGGTRFNPIPERDGGDHAGPRSRSHLTKVRISRRRQKPGISSFPICAGILCASQNARTGTKYSHSRAITAQRDQSQSGASAARRNSSAMTPRA